MVLQEINLRIPMKLFIMILCLITCCCDKRGGHQSDASSKMQKVKTLREAADWLSAECRNRRPDEIGLLLAEMPSKPQVDTKARPNSFVRVTLGDLIVKIGPLRNDIIERVQAGVADCYVWYERNDNGEHWFAGILCGEKIEYFEGLEWPP